MAIDNTTAGAKKAKNYKIKGASTTLTAASLTSTKANGEDGGLSDGALGERQCEITQF